MWFLPAAVPAAQAGPAADARRVRIEMIELAIAGNEALAVSRYEADRGGVNYTAETLAHFHEEEPDAGVVFPVGGRHAPRSAPLAGAGTNLPVGVAGGGPPRGGAAGGFRAPGPFRPAERIESMRRHQVEMPEMGVSSAEIRRRLAAGPEHSLSHAPAVEAYIESHGLYAR